MSHFLLMVLYALVVSTFFGLLWHDDARSRVRLSLKLFLGMVLGALAVAWILYFIPSGPPVPYP